MYKTIIGDVEIASDGMTVWVNGPKGSIGRFGRYGFDVGHSFYGSSSVDAWLDFKSITLGRHGITIPDSHKPKFLAAAEVE